MWRQSKFQQYALAHQGVLLRAGCALGTRLAQGQTPLMRWIDALQTLMYIRQRSEAYPPSHWLTGDWSLLNLQVSHHGGADPCGSVPFLGHSLCSPTHRETPCSIPMGATIRRDSTSLALAQHAALDRLHPQLTRPYVPLCGYASTMVLRLSIEWFIG